MAHSEYSKLDISEFSEADRYKFMMGTVIPFPIALVTSLSRDGVLNAAPFSQFVVISVPPPLLGFVAHEAEDGLKDTVRNILESKEYVINTVTEAMANAGEPHRGVPRQFRMSCARTIQFSHQGSHTHLIVGEIIATHCADGVVSGHRVAHQAMNSLGRIAGRSYCRTGDKFNV
jgi:flavin reductase (DIM6/NTAB) family NADH-FMN oxidoreductase RutF